MTCLESYLPLKARGADSSRNHVHRTMPRACPHVKDTCNCMRHSMHSTSWTDSFTRIRAFFRRYEELKAVSELLVRWNTTLHGGLIVYAAEPKC